MSAAISAVGYSPATTRQVLSPDRLIAERPGLRERNVPRTSIAVAIEIEIERPVDEVWAFVCDLTRLPEWLGEFEKVVNESSGPVGKGVFRYTVVPGPRSATLELVEWEPGRRLAWDGPPLPWAGGVAGSNVRRDGYGGVAADGEQSSRESRRVQQRSRDSRQALRGHAADRWRAAHALVHPHIWGVMLVRLCELRAVPGRVARAEDGPEPAGHP
jgi:uncharacterized protein YndB with AHSA1/START domain